MGYTGGKKKWPTYKSIGGHTEALQIKYDPSVLTYESLVDDFFDDATYYIAGGSSQYKSGIWYNSDEQLKVIQTKCEWIKANKQGQYKNIGSTIEPLAAFYRAEEYHQNYYGKMKM